MQPIKFEDCLPIARLIRPEIVWTAVEFSVLFDNYTVRGIHKEVETATLTFPRTLYYFDRNYDFWNLEIDGWKEILVYEKLRDVISYLENKQKDDKMLSNLLSEIKDKSLEHMIRRVLFGKEDVSVVIDSERPDLKIKQDSEIK